VIPAVAVLEKALDGQAIRAAAQEPRAGALVLFEGCARNHHQGRVVEELAYEAFVPMAEASLTELRLQAIDRFALFACLVHHRIGPVPIGQAAVIVATAAAHRKESFEAAMWIMDRIKEQVPIWKRERYTGGDEAWVEAGKREP
jgi:molybdopterin synthase catalytic subunit